MNQKKVILEKNRMDVVASFMCAGLFSLILIAILFSTNLKDPSEDEIVSICILTASVAIFVIMGIIVNKKVKTDLEIKINNAKSDANTSCNPIFSIRSGQTLRQQNHPVVVSAYDIERVKYVPAKFGFYVVVSTYRSSYLEVLLKNGKVLFITGMKKPKEAEYKMQRALLDYKKENNEL